MSTATIRTIPRILDELRSVGGLKTTDIANFLSVPKSTVTLWIDDRKAPLSSSQLVLSDLHYIAMRLSEHYTPAETRAWFYAKHPQLAGSRSVDLIRKRRSGEVLAILDRLDTGAYL